MNRHSTYLGFDIFEVRNTGAYSPFSTKTLAWYGERRTDRATILRATRLRDLKGAIRSFHSDFKTLNEVELQKKYDDVEARIATVTDKSERTNLLFFSQCLRDEIRRRRRQA